MPLKSSLYRQAVTSEVVNCSAQGQKRIPRAFGEINHNPLPDKEFALIRIGGLCVMPLS